MKTVLRVHEVQTDKIVERPMEIRNSLHFDIQRNTRSNIYRNKKKYTRKSKYKNKDLL